MLQPMTYARSIRAPRGSSDTLYCLSRCVRAGGERWAVIGSLIETAKLNGVEPYAWRRNTLEKMVRGHAMSRLDELLPWRAKTVGSEAS